MSEARERWNRRYAEQGMTPFPDRPAPWLVENRDLVLEAPGRRALDVASGDGRNSLYLTHLGFTVDAIDVSDVAVDAVRAAAAQRGVPVAARRLDLAVDPLPAGPFDVIVEFNYLERALFGALEGALAPGGMLVLETLTRAHVEELGRSFDPAYLLDEGELLRAFPSLRVRHYREGVVERGGRPRAVASLVAQARATITR